MYVCMYAVYTSSIGMPLMISIDTHLLCIPEFETSNMAKNGCLVVREISSVCLVSSQTMLKHVEPGILWSITIHYDSGNP